MAKKKFYPAKKKVTAKKKGKKSKKAVPHYTPEQLDVFREEHPAAFGNALKSMWAGNPEMQKQAFTGLGLSPQTTVGGVPGQMTVGGGQQQFENELAATQLAQQMEIGRQGLATGILSQVQDVQRDPFNIVNAMQAYGAGGGGTMGAASALAQTGGRGSTPFGNAAQSIMDSLVRFATGQGGSETAPAAAPGAAGAAPTDPWAEYFKKNPGALTDTPEKKKKLADILTGLKNSPTSNPYNAKGYTQGPASLGSGAMLT